MKFNNRELEEKIFEHAAGLVFTLGATGWNMDRLAAVSGIVKNTLYRIIDSKEALVGNIFLSRMEETGREIFRAMERNGGVVPGLEGMTNPLIELLTLIYSEPARDIFLEYPSIEERARSRREEIFSAIIGHIEKGTRTGEIREGVNPGIVFELFQGAVLFHLGGGSDAGSRTGRIREGLSYILEGIRSTGEET